MVSKEDVICAALQAAYAAYMMDTTDHETVEEAQEMYHYMMAQIARIPILAVAEWRQSHPESRMSEGDILDLIRNEHSKSPALRTH
jgi:hypothetical protein